MIFVRTIICLMMVWFISGCTVSFANDAEDNYTLGSALTKLSTAVESTVRYKNPPPDMKDLELLRFSTQHDPKLLEPFTDYLLKTFVQNRHVIVLVCDEHGKYSVLEDAGCSSTLDEHAWKKQPEKPCEFTINLNEACPDKANN